MAIDIRLRHWQRELIESLKAVGLPPSVATSLATDPSRHLTVGGVAAWSSIEQLRLACWALSTVIAS